jgi:phosphatidylserine/phosphatidylglycerophosphate/cardiolipin synthase-like enzyme
MWAVAALLAAAEPDPTYDHQLATYNATFAPVSVTGAALSLTPYFSPEASSDILVALIDSARQTLDIETPGISSWSGCTTVRSGCMGCSVAEISSREAFPLFNATLNAIHRGVEVRIVTNDYSDALCRNKTDLSTYLALAGASVAHYRSTTFMHAKFMLVDGSVGDAASPTARVGNANATASISSINWSVNSFTNNREAGVLLSGAGAAPLLSFTRSVYDRDFELAALYTPDGAALFSPADLALIADPAQRPARIPVPPAARHYTPPVAVAMPQAAADVTLWTSPDYAGATLLADIDAAVTSLDLFIYQITSEELCDALLALGARGVAVSVLVSASIYGAEDAASAQAIYARLHGAPGVELRMAYQYRCVLTTRPRRVPRSRRAHPRTRALKRRSVAPPTIMSSRPSRLPASRRRFTRAATTSTTITSFGSSTALESGSPQGTGRRATTRTRPTQRSCSPRTPGRLHQRGAKRIATLPSRSRTRPT